MSQTIDSILAPIRARADAIDQTGEWPAEDLRLLAAADFMRAAIAKEFGGTDRSAIEIHLDYERLAAASLSVALIISQRDSACGLLEAAPQSDFRDNLLRQLARNDGFATIGIAQLTTSRQRGAPALLATRVEKGWRLNGVIPWSTGADHARWIVAGAIIEEDVPQRRQILFCLPRDSKNVRVAPPLPLVALRSSHTSAIVCEGAVIPDTFVLDGPAESVLKKRSRGLSIGQAFLAMGLCRNAIDLIGEIDSASARQTAEQFSNQLNQLRDDAIAFAKLESGDPALAATLRGRCGDLAVRATHAAVALHKGSALLAGHPAQRLARESMFLLVWSCPNPVIDRTVELLLATGGSCG